MDAVRLLISTLACLVVWAGATMAAAQEDANPDPSGADGTSLAAGGETILWDIRGDDAARLDAFRKAVEESLADGADRHLLSELAFTEYLRARAPGTPACLRGVADCVAPGTVVFDALDLSSLVQIDVLAVGANYDVVDGRGQSVRQGQVVEPDARKLGFAVVRAIFDATGVMKIDSTPRGATVELDGRAVGTTPLTYRVAVGEHTYRLRLPRRMEAAGTVTVASDKVVAVVRELEMTPGSLVVQDAPADADVLIDGKRAGKAGEPISLGPGTYTVEVRAQGYAPFSDSVTIEPGVTATRSATLHAANAFLQDVASEAILYNSYILRFGFEYGFQRATFQDARSNDEFPYEFISFADNNGNLPGSGVVLSEGLGTLGMRLEAAYAFRNFGIVPLSLSYLTRKTKYAGYVAQRGAAAEPITITSVKRLQLRPFQMMYRYVYRNFVPFAEAGIGINFSWLNAEGAVFEGPKTLRRTDALWTLGLGLQYYLTGNYFGMFRYSVQDYFDRGLGTDHQISLGVGAAFPNLFGLAPEPPEKL